MTQPAPLLLPPPRRLTRTGDGLTLAPRGHIIAPPAVLFEAQTLQSALHAAGLDWSLAAAGDPATPHITLVLSELVGHPQGYRLFISPHSLTLTGSATGLFYAVCTLRQLLMQYGPALPGLAIEDTPDFPARGVMLDCSRDKVPTLDTLLALIDLLASLKINQLQLYMEHTFAYARHGAVWAAASPFTGEDILRLGAFCRQRHIDLVPNQNSLGHMERWLKFPQYNDLAECPAGFEPPWGGPWRSASTLNPLDPRSLELVAGLYDELLPHFTSPLFNVGGDEPWEFGKGHSRAAVEQRGGRVYLEYLQKLHRLVTAHGRQMQFWGDIIIHYPDLIPELPGDAIAMEWGYEANHDFDGHSALFARAGIPFYLCCGTSSWNSLIGRTDNALGNIRSAAENGLKYGASGILNTDWGDNGHWQPLPVSYAGFAYGAAVSWCLSASSELDLAAALDVFVFRDKTGTMGRLALDLGNVYQIVGPAHSNGQALAYALQMTRAEIEQYRLRAPLVEPAYRVDVSPAALRRALARVDEIMQPIDGSIMQRPDATLIISEFKQAAALARHGARWLLLATGDEDESPLALENELRPLIERQRLNWLARNRPGGLEDSLARFDGLLVEYRRAAGG
ncbi:MAG: family 20 glycosylhydrolase [Anaerolineae bacterium]|nr:family 20 glycosylhydrolase [Anaerolineae bacterium]